MSWPAWVGERGGHWGGLGQGVLLRSTLISAPVSVSTGVHLVRIRTARTLDIQFRIRITVVKIRATSLSSQTRFIISETITRSSEIEQMRWWPQIRADHEAVDDNTSADCHR